MALSKLKSLHQVQAVRVFTDREEARQAFRRNLNAYVNDGLQLRVLMYYGVGGIGKTTLLKHLYEEVCETSTHSPLHIAKLNLESAQFDTPAACLHAIRNQLDVPCHAFEYALARYWALRGWSLEDIRRQPLRQDSLLFDLVEAAADAAGLFAPARLVMRLWDYGDDVFRRMLGEERVLFQEIDQLPEDEIEEHLPYYLGLAIERAAIHHRQKFLVFLDSHETILYRPAYQTTKHIGDVWLQELIGASEHGLYVIAGREYLKWAEPNPEWSDYTEQHILGELADSDAQHFLRSVPIGEPEIRDAIVATAHGVPLYLDLCASTYIIRKKDGDNLTERDFRLAESDVIRRFISHLDREQAEALRICALVERFDIDLFSTLMQHCNIPFPLTLFSEFCQTSYTAIVDSSSGVYKIHDIVRTFIHNDVEGEVAQRVMTAIVAHAADTYSVHSSSRSAWLFQQALILAVDFGLSLNRRAIVELTEVGWYVIDAGHWTAVEGALNLLLAIAAPSDIPAELSFLLARCLRKRGALLEAQEVYQTIVGREDLGSWKYLAEYHAAHTDHLLGNYNDAFRRYEYVMQVTDKDERAQIARRLAARQATDVLMLRGQFDDALKAFREQTRQKLDDPLWQIELLRFQGHVYRFNFLLVEAEERYMAAKALSEGHQADAMRGKSLTNLAETLCWTAPYTAISLAEEAIQLNRQVDNMIEVGKAMAAQAVALAANPDGAVRALLLAQDAETLQLQNGYRSGVLFALRAQGLALIADRRLEEGMQVLQRMERLVQELGGVYAYLPLVLIQALDHERLEPYASGFQWLEKARTLDFIKGLHHRFSR